VNDRASFPIAGGDYRKGGSATAGIKTILKQVGVPEKELRRAMIAAYEAEMNVVIHATRGTATVRLVPDRLEIVIEDEGPGIPDIDLAMKEGYSTAPREAVVLGFGAGKGLPNIRRRSDEFEIRSEVGKGTRVRFAIGFTPTTAAGAIRSTIAVDASRCNRCLRCLHACPTGAMRLRPTGPAVLDERCIDCTQCIASCDRKALGIRGAHDRFPDSPAVLAVPSAFLCQFGPSVTPDRAIEALASLAPEIAVLGPWEDALREAVADHARGDARPLPVISPACPAAVRLIQVRYPALIPHLAPFVGAAEAVREARPGRTVRIVADCPARCAAFGAETGGALVDFAALANRLNADVARPSPPPEVPAPRPTEPASPTYDVIPVRGPIAVMNAFEQAENGRLGALRVLEPWMCNLGCWSAPPSAANPYLARHHYAAHPPVQAGPGHAVRRDRPVDARPGLRIDADLRVAVEKLARIDRIAKTLPGRDCGLCGAPTCLSLAEDAVLGGHADAECPLGEDGKGRG
jgi:anti-sigma regulatory factor (Ser/Thr protein kinase)/Na+-translocating ferredoxin:NAD+ oxidoreductase RNF subunit RnfB